MEQEVRKTSNLRKNKVIVVAFVILLCILLVFAPAFISLFNVYSFLSLSNWRFMITMSLVFNVTSTLSLIFFTVLFFTRFRYYFPSKGNKNRLLPTIISAITIPLFLIIFIYFAYQNSVSLYKDLQSGVKTYSGPCEVKYNQYISNRTLIHYNYYLVINNIDVQTTKSIWQSLGGSYSEAIDQKCNKEIKINYLENSKLQITLDN